MKIRRPARYVCGLALGIAVLAVGVGLASSMLGKAWLRAHPLPIGRVEEPVPAATPAPEPKNLPALTVDATFLAPPLAVAEPSPSDFHFGDLPYEAAMLAIMQSPAPRAEKAQALFALLPRVPEEALTTTAEQASLWLRDRDYAKVAGPVLTNPETHGMVLSALFADLMERPDTVALPLLLQIARSPEHPLARSARDNLALLLGRNLGANWPAWEAAISQRLSAAGH